MAIFLQNALVMFYTALQTFMRNIIKLSWLCQFLLYSVNSSLHALVHHLLTLINSWTQQLQQKEWKPDFGPAEFNPRWGATVTGARNFLIAYNINVLSTKEQAHRIALNIREQGRGEEQVRSVGILSCLVKEIEIFVWER